MLAHLTACRTSPSLIRAARLGFSSLPHSHSQVSLNSVCFKICRILALQLISAECLSSKTSSTRTITSSQTNPNLTMLINQSTMGTLTQQLCRILKIRDCSLSLSLTSRSPLAARSVSTTPASTLKHKLLLLPMQSGLTAKNCSNSRPNSRPIATLLSLTRTSPVTITLALTGHLRRLLFS